MTDTELNIAVAEVLGWKCDADPSRFWQKGNKFMHRDSFAFSTDLNAAAEMEATLDQHIPFNAYGGRWDSQADLYVCLLLCEIENLEIRKFQVGVFGFSTKDLHLIASAPARQRCIAFLRTVKPELDI